ncbi:hypothetical protein Pcinc_028747 [Petrolisthes cinctipes]|uniref:Uncharacterized protein n=1 Tax=Petrolisthes cinctipes TaxID=88211 RepID=A0AAE1F317_PETCI|nr:hypothetical protein Pcinc_028747 [Petrolisthes cinctipes]
MSPSCPQVGHQLQAPASHSLVIVHSPSPPASHSLSQLLSRAPASHSLSQLLSRAPASQQSLQICSRGCDPFIYLMGDRMQWIASCSSFVDKSWVSCWRQLEPYARPA